MGGRMRLNRRPLQRRPQRGDASAVRANQQQVSGVFQSALQPDIAVEQGRKPAQQSMPPPLRQGELRASGRQCPKHDVGKVLKTLMPCE